MIGDKPVHLETRAADGAKQFSPTAGRNKTHIGAVLSKILPHGAHILEIASGTGEHGAHVCGLREDITWQPSDPSEDARASQNAWSQLAGGKILPALAIDTSAPGWTQDLPRYDAVFCSNMIHIAPWEAALGLADGVARLLNDGGQIILYGPFKEGADTAPSNLEFDATLKSRDPRWGVRDLDAVKHIFAKLGFNHCVRTAMPKNNLILVFKRSEA